MANEQKIRYILYCRFFCTLILPPYYISPKRKVDFIFRSVSFFHWWLNSWIMKMSKYIYTVAFPFHKPCSLYLWINWVNRFNRFVVYIRIYGDEEGFFLNEGWNQDKLHIRGLFSYLVWPLFTLKKMNQLKSLQTHPLNSVYNFIPTVYMLSLIPPTIP